MGSGSSVKLVDPAQNPAYAPKHDAPFHIALKLECADFPQSPLMPPKVDKPVPIPPCVLLVPPCRFPALPAAHEPPAPISSPGRRVSCCILRAPLLPGVVVRTERDANRP